MKFADCDPAGIVYFPRFLEMANDLVEDWFDARLIPFKEFHFSRGWGVPLVNTKVDFLKACRLGETLHMRLGVEALGRSSAVLAIRGLTQGEERLRLRHKVAIVSLQSRRAIAIPAELRARMERFVSSPATPSPEPVAHDGRVPPSAFRSRHLIRFSHCDPAGIAFYPRFFDLFSSALEDWFQSGIDSPFGGDFMVKRNLRVPSLSITAEFVRPCRLGEFLDIDVWVARLGRSSFELALAGSVAGEPRLRAAWTMCMIDFATFKSTPIPDDLRQRMQSFGM
ncbi:MAG TPA: thioesterase family protein [Burkholderiales bacterium]|nr:thioesterase family protein [Burkholderiales bacterium]